MRKCKECGGPSGVVDSREVEDAMQRKRRCRSCGSEWFTMEIVGSPAQLSVDALFKGIKGLCSEVDRLAKQADLLFRVFNERFPNPGIPYRAKDRR